VKLLETAVASGKPVIVVIVAGSAVLVESWQHGAGAILQSFYAGMEGGTALARLLLGEVSPSGKLPFTVARRPEDYPDFDPFAERITYGPYHGYTLAAREGWTPRFPFGYGLSYTRFSYRALRARVFKDAISVQVTIANEGVVAADEVVQLYVGFPGVEAERPTHLLRGFERVPLAPGESRTVRMRVPLEQLKWYDPDARDWRLEPGEHQVLVGGSSDPARCLTTTVRF